MGTRHSRIKIPVVKPLRKSVDDDHTWREPLVENLVFEGGGVLGIAYLGAIEVLENAKLLDGITRYAGTSAGAIYATVMACGYTVRETKELMQAIDFSKLLDKSCLPVNILNLFMKFGYCNGRVCEDLIKSCIGAKTGNENLTFKQLYDKYGRELVIIGCNLNKLREVTFSHKESPDFPIYKAVRISMSAPFVFKPVEINGDLFIDGGVVNNYPLFVFDNLDKTIGLKLLSRSEHATDDIYEGHFDVSNIVEYSSTLIRSLAMAAERNSVRPGYWEHTIGIKTGNLNTMNFKLSDANKNYLISNARASAETYVKRILII